MALAWAVAALRAARLRPGPFTAAFAAPFAASAAAEGAAEAARWPSPALLRAFSLWWVEFVRAAAPACVVPRLEVFFLRFASH